ncbi:competence/damage-inducible protein A [uncultured Cardiobacterium sp.]|uniref:competence/damage-inducible protein A n=1 Tax=uncultured Cardiobacterium sp. TaxID=417619 RepID=UPI002609306E|nr:competence/damage-inducible protein A [uncultured Cardiobacterium sp.]
MKPERIQLLIIGNEILSGRRSDIHLANTIAACNARGLRIDAAHYLGDDADALIRHYRRALAAGEAVLSFGGIGATPDDRTRQAVAAACHVPLAFHPEGDALLRAKYGDNEYTAARRELIHFPQGATLIPNPVNNIPGFSLQHIHCVPGFPQMAEPMMIWVLDHYYRYLARARHYQALDVFAPESRLAPIMQTLEAMHPQVAISSLPKLHFESELGFDGTPDDCAAAVATACRLLDEAEMQWREHEAS